MEMTTAIASNPKNEWIVIDLGYKIRGEFHFLEAGKQYVEGELSRQSWADGVTFGHHLLKSIAAAFSLGEDVFSLQQRMTRGIGREVLASVVLTVSHACQNVERLHSIAAQFIRGVVSQPSINFGEQRPIETKNICDEVLVETQNFLRIKGGKKVKNHLRLSIENEEVATVFGNWKPMPDTIEKDTREIVISGFYDGRRLRDRYLVIVGEGGHAASHEIYYDEDVFDQQLRDLQDDKMTVLEVRVKKETCGREVRLDLVEMRVVPRLLELQLVG